MSIGDTLLYSTGQYLGRELSGLGARYAYVPGIPTVTAAASRAGMALASGREGLLVTAMPDTLEKLEQLAACAETLALLKVNKRLPVLMDFIRAHKPAGAVLLHRLGLEGEGCFDLTTDQDMPRDIGYLSIAIVRRG